MNKSALIILSYNKPQLTDRCLASIMAAQYPYAHLFLLSNGSNTQTNLLIQKKYPFLQTKCLMDNRGFSGGFNAALQWVFSQGYDSVLFLTNDTTIAPGTVEACEQTAWQASAGIVAPCIHYLTKPNSIDSIGGYFQAHTASLHHCHDQDLPEQLDPSQDYIPGTALWITKDTFTALNGADDTYHTYWEDADLSFRAHQKGIGLARSYGAIVHHGVGQTCHKKPLYTTFYYQRNRIRFCKRFLTGTARVRALDVIENELNKKETLWKEKQDKNRLDYLTLLRQELKHRK